MTNRCNADAARSFSGVAPRCRCSRSIGWPESVVKLSRRNFATDRPTDRPTDRNYDRTGGHRPANDNPAAPQLPHLPLGFISRFGFSFLLLVFRSLQSSEAEKSKQTHVTQSHRIQLRRPKIMGKKKEATGKKKMKAGLRNETGKQNRREPKKKKNTVRGEQKNRTASHRPVSVRGKWRSPSTHLSLAERRGRRGASDSCQRGAGLF